MKPMNNRQKGVTLIEVLATIVILASISGLVYGVFFQSLNSYEKTQSHALLRQEANLILAELTNAHRENDSYKVSTNSSMLLYVNNQEISNDSFHYKLLMNGTDVANTTNGFLVDTTKYIDVELTVIDPSHDNESFTISTVIQKLSKGSDANEE